MTLATYCAALPLIVTGICVATAILATLFDGDRQ